MIVCIIPKQDHVVYSAIKRICCIDMAIPTQVVTKKNLELKSTKTRSVITKIAIQMSCKIGGAVWGIIVPVRVCILKILLRFRFYFIIYFFKQIIKSSKT
jgi:aubergine-like protein